MLNPPLYEEIIETIAIPRASWQRDNAYMLVQHLTWEARVWSHFSTSTIMPVDHTYSLKLEDALLVYCIIKKCPIDVSRIISKKIFEVANSSKPDTWLPYPGLNISSQPNQDSGIYTMVLEPYFVVWMLCTRTKN